MANSFHKLVHGKKLKVVVVGNSVTAGSPEDQAVHPSFYVVLHQWLRKTFPAAEIRVVPKIIFAIGPEVQLFYLDERVIAEKPDLVLAEFGAANGAWGEAGRTITEPATEGWIRRLRGQLPECDVILMMGLFKSMMADYEAGKTPPSAAFLQTVAGHYNALAVDAGAETAARIRAGEPWETYMQDSIHPAPEGYALYSQTLVSAVERQWEDFRQGRPPRPVEPHKLPAATLCPSPWQSPRLVPATEAETDGFETIPSGPLTFLASTTRNARGVYAAPQGRRVIGIFMREQKPSGNLEVRHPDGAWIRLSQKKEPHFTIKEDPENRLFRNFFAAYGLPPALREVRFRVSPNPEEPDGRHVQIAGFFTIASD